MSTQLAPRATSVASRPTRQLDIRATLQSENVMNQVSLALPKGYDAARFMRIVVTAVNTNPKLAECDPQSILLAVMKGAAMGIECDGRLGHLIPRWNGKKNCNEASFQADYKGLVALVRKNPNVGDVYAENVHAADHFDITKGLHRDLVHKIDVRKPRGEIIGSYAVVTYRDGTSPSFEFMSVEETNAIRDRSDGWKSFKAKGFSTPWNTDDGEMRKKTVLKRLLKLADLSADTRERLDNDSDDHEARPVIPISVESAPVTASLPEASAEPEPLALEESTESAEPEPEQLPEPEAERPARQQRRKPAERVAEAEPVAEPEPEPAAQEPEAEKAPFADPEPDTPVGEIRARIADEGFQESAFVGMMVAYRYLQDGQTLDDLAPAKVQTLLAQWPAVVTAMKKKGN